MSYRESRSVPPNQGKSDQEELYRSVENKEDLVDCNESVTLELGVAQ